MAPLPWLLNGPAYESGARACSPVVGDQLRRAAKRREQLAAERVPAAPCARRRRPRSTAASRGLLAARRGRGPRASRRRIAASTSGWNWTPHAVAERGTPAGRPGCSRARVAPGRRLDRVAVPLQRGHALAARSRAAGRRRPRAAASTSSQPSSRRLARTTSPARGLARAAARRGRRRARAGRPAASRAAARARR